MVMERLNTEGVIYKLNKQDNVEEFDDVGEGVGMENGKYKSKYWPEVESPTDVKIGTSFTGMMIPPCPLMTRVLQRRHRVKVKLLILSL